MKLHLYLAVVGLLAPAAFGQPIKITTGPNAPQASACINQGDAGDVYVRSENPSNGPIGVFRCTQVAGPAASVPAFAWMPIDHFVGTALPLTCAVGDIAFDSDATAGSNIYGCTAVNTWTLQAGGGGSGTVTNLATTSPITGGPVTTTGTIACAACVVASSPGTGIAHFAGSTQTVTSSAISLTADVSGVLPSANGGSPLTTKGDVFGFSTVNARIPIGTDGQVLTADSAQTLGLKWATVSGSGTVTTTGAMTADAILVSSSTGGTVIQTPSATATLDSGGTFSTPGSFRSGVGGADAGFYQFGQGAAPTAGTTAVTLYADSAVTSYIMRLPAAAATGFVLGTNTAGDVVQSFVGSSGTGNVARVASPTFTTPTLGAASATSINGLTLTSSTGTLTIPNGVVLTGPAASGTAAVVIASGTSALGTGAIASADCATVVTTSATGTATTDVVTASFNGDPTGVTGYVPSTAGMLSIIAYPSSNNVNFKVCNNTAGSITPGAITLNWRVAR